MALLLLRVVQARRSHRPKRRTQRSLMARFAVGLRCLPERQKSRQTPVHGVGDQVAKSRCGARPVSTTRFCSYQPINTNTARPSTGLVIVWRSSTLRTNANGKRLKVSGERPIPGFAGREGQRAGRAAEVRDDICVLESPGFTGAAATTESADRRIPGRAGGKVGATKYSKYVASRSAQRASV